MKRNLCLLPFGFCVLFSACGQKQPTGSAVTVKTQAGQTETLPQPYATKSSTNFSKVIGWNEGETPVAPAGFTVTKFADSLDNPRWSYQASNGDIFVVESATKLSGIKRLGVALSRKLRTQNIGSSKDMVLLYRDEDKNGSYESVYPFATELNQPFGMLELKGKFYIANTDGLQMWDYKPGDTVLRGAGTRILNLPAGGYNNHWTRNIIANKAGTKIYVSVGSGSNNAEHGMENEVRRANILEINPDGSGERIYGAGLRNPVGMDWEPVSGKLWTAVNERDKLGDDLVPDYATSVQPGGFYGWPYAYFGNNPDPRMTDEPHTDLVNKTIVPDVALGAHTASLGLAFYNGTKFPAIYRGGMFIGQHGSWNRKDLSGYKVVFVPFAKGKPSGKPVDFLTNFIVEGKSDEVRGRPVGVTVLRAGSMLVCDDASNTVWKISYP